LISFLSWRRGTLASLLVAVTAVFSWFALSLRVDPGVESVLPSSGGDLGRLREFNATFGSDEVIVLALHSDRLFSLGALKVIDDLTQKAAALPHVARVLSPTNARDLDGDELGPFSVVPYEKVVSGELPPDKLARRLGTHPLYGGLLVSGDARTAAVLIEVERVEGNRTYRSDLVRRVRRLASHAGSGIRTYVAGIPVEKVDVAASVKRDQMIFVPLVFVVMAGIVAALYRHPVGVVVPLSVIAASLIWTLGLYGLAGRSLNPVTSLMTPVVLVVSVAGVVHLINHFLAARAEGLPRPAALRRALLLTRVPCFNAALTTAIGFGSLMVLPIPAIRDFGLFTAAGVMFSYMLTVTLAPLLLASLPDFPRRVTSSFRPGAIERALRSISRWVCGHPFGTGAATLAVLGLSGAGIARMRVETDLIHSLRPRSPLYQATRFIDHQLTGVNSLEVLVKGVAPVDPEGLRKVEAFERQVRVLPGIRKVTGVTDLFKRVNRAFHGGGDAFAKLPEGAGAGEDLADFRELLRKEAPEELTRFVSPDGKVLRLAARVTALDTGSSQRLFKEIRAAAARAGLGDVDLTGNFAVLSDMSTSLVRNQVKGLVPALVLILTALAVQFRSVRLGLLSVIPNGAPVLMVYGLMGWCGIPLSVPTAMIASIAVGMTVDNTIHLMARFREAFREGAGYPAALAKMLDGSGRAVVFSTLTVAAGFGVGAFSSFLPSVHFAVLTGAALVLGLVGEATLLPLTLILFRPLGPPPDIREKADGKAALGALFWVVLLVTPLADRPAQAAPAAPDVTLRDQFGRQDGPGLHRGRIVLLVYGKGTSLRRMKTWELRILEKTREGPEFLRAVDARSLQGRKTVEEVNRRLQQNVPPGIPVLIDWKGELARAFAIPEAEVAVTVIDPQGRRCTSVPGPVDNSSLGRVLDTIIHLQEKGHCP